MGLHGHLERGQGVFRRIATRATVCDDGDWILAFDHRIDHQARASPENE